MAPRRTSFGRKDIESHSSPIASGVLGNVPLSSEKFLESWTSMSHFQPSQVGQVFVFFLLESGAETIRKKANTLPVFLATSACVEFIYLNAGNHISVLGSLFLEMVVWNPRHFLTWTPTIRTRARTKTTHMDGIKLVHVSYLLLGLRPTMFVM